MKKFLLVPILAMTFSTMSIGQNKGTVDAKMLNEIRSDFTLDASSRAIQNAITNAESIRELALNHEKIGKTDHFFKYRVDVKGITNQESSGRCWMFTSMNTIRPEVMKKFNLNSFDFSHNYNYFWDLFEKSNLFLENIIATADRKMDDREVVLYFKGPVDDGGVWNSFFNIAKKYGVVPSEVMPETKVSNSTREITGLINEKLRGEGYKLRNMIAEKASVKDIALAKMTALKSIYRMLTLSLGEPPVNFSWRFKDADGKISESKMYTPKEFLAEINPDFANTELVMIMNDPTREYYKVYEIKNYRNVEEGINWTYLNLPNDEIKKFAMASIKNNEAMYASCDVGKQHNRKAGVMDLNTYDYASLLGVEFDMDKKARVLTRQSGSSHAMALIGVDVDENEVPVKWEFENSWGSTSGNNGYLTFTDEWFSEYMFRVVINKNYLDEKAKKALKTAPILLPVWDYMF
ncbi:C1 family peptidase [Labilibaculum sp. K2S]|uniref:aminopeptidase C n=1 Tax=Labilibaculum sp. K2S TaxID=3056386 RepID=UPI0025A3677A|nr:C1 family peptidase [Labilibaculum sp. K2S]MDM8161659.1 C1 family peptidase [Labilibaculum sp. K2S]